MNFIADKLTRVEKVEGLLDDGQGKSKEKQGAAATLTSLLEMFQFSSGHDACLLFAGVLSTIAHSASFPIMALLLGNISQTFICQSQSFLHQATTSANITHNSSRHTRDDYLTLEEHLNYTSKHGHQHHKHVSRGGSDSPFALIAQVFAYLGKALGLFSDSKPMSKQEFSAYAQTFSLYFLGFALLVFVSSYLQTICFDLAAENQISNIRKTFVKQMLRQELSWFEKRSAGYLITKLADDVERVREGIGHKFSIILEYCFCFLICAFFGLCINWKLTFIFGLSVPFIITKIVFLLRVFAQKAVDRQERYAKVGAVCEEVLPLVKTVAVFGTQMEERQRFERELAANYTRALKDFHTIGIGTGILYILIFSAFGVATIYASNQLLHHYISKRQVFTVFSCMSVGIVALSNILPLITEIAYSHGCTQSIMKVIGNQPIIDPYSTAGRRPFNFGGKVRLSHVTFSHKSRKDTPVLKDINLTVPAGSTIAIVGPSGEGKSTIADLLLRFYDPQDGNITLDDFDLRQLNLRWLRANVGIVTSHSEFMTDSIYENIRCGMQGVFEEDIIKAAKTACAHNFILKLPEGYKTMIGITDRELTRWQKQLLAIARILVKKQKILILDEAYSAVHMKTAKKLIKQLIYEGTNRTTIVISNSIARIHMVDKIYVMKGGEIVESGSHAELLYKGGVYFELSLDEDMEAISKGLEELDELHPETIDVPEDEIDTRDMHREDSEESAYSEVSEDFGKPDYSQPIPEFKRTIKDEMRDLFVKNPFVFTFSVIGFMGCVITGLVPPLFALIYSQLFISFAESGDQLTADTAYWSKFVFLSGFICGFGYWLRTIFAGALGENLARFMREDTYFSIIRKKVAWFDSEDHAPEKLHALISRGIPIFKHAIGMRLGGVISGVVSLFVTIIVSFALQWQLGVVIMVEAGVHYYIIQRLKWSHESIDEAIESIMSKANSIAGEAVQNIRTIKTLSLEEDILRQFSFVMNSADEFSKPHVKCVGIAFACSQAMTFVSFAAIFFVGAILIDSQGMDPINLFKVFMVLCFSTFAIGQIASFVPDYMRAMTAYGNLVNLKGADPSDLIFDFQPSLLRPGLRPDIKGVVEFSHVTYSEENLSDEPIFDDVSFKIEPGHCLGIVGGENDSLLMSIILGFHEPQSGTVYIDGIDLKDLDLRHLRHSIGLAAYTRLFNRSIRENMLYGYKGGKMDETEVKALLDATAETVRMKRFISELPEGYETKVGAQGTCLTTGQTQRILLARAIVRDPKILLLEDPTSCLDAQLEEEVLAQLKQIIKTKTCIVSSREPSVIELADHIIVFRNGRVSESGTAEELFALKGQYFRFMTTK